MSKYWINLKSIKKDIFRAHFKSMWKKEEKKIFSGSHSFGFLDKLLKNFLPEATYKKFLLILSNLKTHGQQCEKYCQSIWAKFLWLLIIWNQLFWNQLFESKCKLDLNTKLMKCVASLIISVSVFYNQTTYL